MPVMEILGIETSCDETSVAVVQNGQVVLAQSLASSLKLHAKFGGVIPELAAREQTKVMIPILQDCLSKMPADWRPDAIAVTTGPGLIGSLLVGIETAKTLALLWKKPLIPVNHLLGHLYSPWLTHKTIPLPSLALIASGGHTDLLHLGKDNRLTHLGSTRDDAAGEAFDKTAKLLGLPYPGGPAVSNLAKLGNGQGPKLPRPMINEQNFDFSFSGLKTAVYYYLKDSPLKNEQDKANLAQSFEQAVCDVLVYKTIRAARAHQSKSILLTGGVAANTRLRTQLTKSADPIPVFYPELKYCTDNAAMIACAAHFINQPLDWHQVHANPSLHF